MVEAMLEVSEWKFGNLKSLMWMENRDWADMAQSEKTHVLHGRDYINDEMYGYKYRIWFDTFFQTNPLQAEKLVKNNGTIIGRRSHHEFFFFATLFSAKLEQG